MYYLAYGLLYLLSLLPMRVLYLISDFLYLLLYRVFGYRRKVVIGNLRIAFPEKAEEELSVIARKFYHQFFDSFLETIKLLSCGEKFLNSRLHVNLDELNAVYEEGFSSQMHLGHNFNWEWANVVLAAHTRPRTATVYMPIINKTMERLFLKLRSRTGSALVPATPSEAFRAGLRELRNEKYVLVLVADQSPGDASKAYWLNFFGKPTAFVTGPDKSARLNKLPVFFAYLRRIKRGYYEGAIKLVAKDPRKFKDGELTVMFARFLEEAIRQQPENWLWSHRRWKRDWKPEYEDLWIDDPKKIPSIHSAISNRL